MKLLGCLLGRADYIRVFLQGIYCTNVYGAAYSMRSSSKAGRRAQVLRAATIIESFLGTLGGQMVELSTCVFILKIRNFSGCFTPHPERAEIAALIHDQYLPAPLINYLQSVRVLGCLCGEARDASNSSERMTTKTSDQPGHELPPRTFPTYFLLCSLSQESKGEKGRVTSHARQRNILTVDGLTSIHFVR